MNTQWLAMEHYRLHVIEQWPDDARKETALAAVRSAIRSLASQVPDVEVSTVCWVCGGRSQSAVLEFPSRPAKPAERAA